MTSLIFTVPEHYKKILAAFYVLSILLACSHEAENNAPQKSGAASAKDIITLAADSPKKSYIKTVSLELTQRPLLEPLAGKVVLNENLTSRITSPVAGRVLGKPAGLGENVKAGTPLLLLDSPDVAAAEADYAKAQADLALSMRAYARQQELYAGKAISRKELEQAQDVLAQDRSEAQRAKERLRNLRISPNNNDGRFALQSPISGTIVERHVNPGIEVRPDLPEPLFVISDFTNLALVMEIFEVNLPYIKLGQNVMLTVPAYPGRRFPATVKYIGQELDEDTRTVLVRCDLPNREGKLLPGMYATVELQSDAYDQALVIPLTAVFTEDDTDYVFIALDNNRYKKLPIKLGLRLKDRAVVAGGLEPGQTLVSEGALMLRTEETVEESTS